MRVDQARRLKELEQENTRLKKLVADLSLDNAILLDMTTLFIEPGSPWENGLCRVVHRQDAG